MAEFDPQQVVEAVQSKLAPDDWVVVSAQRGLLFAEVIRSSLYALGGGVVSLLFLFLWLYTISQMFVGEPDFIYGMLALFVGFVVGAILAIAFIIQAWTAARMLTAAQKPWIAVTPNGVLEYRGPHRGVRFAFAFANVVSIIPISKQPARSKWLNPFYEGAALTFSRRHPANPTKLFARTWIISPGYPLPEELAQLVILAQRAYRSRTIARSPWNSFLAIEPVDPRMRQIANPTGWSWTLTVGGVCFVLMALAWAAFVGWSSLSYSYVPWLPSALDGFLFASGPMCWLLAWRINDWKREI